MDFSKCNICITYMNGATEIFNNIPMNRVTFVRGKYMEISDGKSEFTFFFHALRGYSITKIPEEKIVTSRDADDNYTW